jgi:S-DNA-T family DNA segregation ATPase FtsK/SpoIIIE
VSNDPLMVQGGESRAVTLASQREASYLTVTQTRELLEGLRGVVKDFAAAEDKLNKEFRAKMDATEKRFKEDAETHETQLAAQLTEAEAAYQNGKARIESLHEKRKAHIARALKSSHKLSAKRIDDQEGHWKYKSQKGLLDTKRFRTDALAKNDATFAEFGQQLADSRGAFAALEADVQKAFGGYGKFRRLLQKGEVLANTDFAPDEYELLQKAHELREQTGKDLARFRKLFLPKLFRVLPLWIWIVLLLGFGGASEFAALGLPPGQHLGAILSGVVLVLVLVVYALGAAKGAASAKTIANELATAQRLHDICLQKSQTRHVQEVERIEREAKNSTEMFQENWRSAVEQAANARELWPVRIDEKWRRVVAKNDAQYTVRAARVEQEHATAVSCVREEADARQKQFTGVHEAKVTKFNADYQAHWQKLETDWKQLTQPIFETIAAANETAKREFPEWQRTLWQNWKPPGSFKNIAKFARLEVDVKKLAEAAPRDPRLAFPAMVSLPLLLSYPQQGSILFETTKSGNELVVEAINNIMFRLISTAPAGKLSFTIIDPVKLGQNFAGVMHLADYEDNLINSRILTQAGQIEQRLADLNEHMEKVIQMYLRNEYETIAEYNVQAGNIAEKYHFVVVADFPSNFTETAARRLLHIAASGARCGVYTLIHWDHRHTAPADFFPEELRKSSVCISGGGEQFALANPFLGGTHVVLDAPPDTDFATEFLHRVGEASRGANRVEVPFEQVAPPDNEIWTEETADELRVPIGRSGATKLQYLAIGKGTRQHALIAGKTGSGKSTLFHVIITNLALWCSPEQVEFYLVDFKKGVEFKSYATNRLPHAKVVAIESDREFGLSVLQRLDEELKRRGELFRQLGVQDVAGYKRNGGTEPMPRALLMIDEFQEFFVEDDRISQAANLLLDRIVRQGRAFGIHCLLGSQTLGGAYTLARTTIGQMVIRIALQCNEADAYLIMDENNPAPRLLSRPGEGIYNDMAGMSEGNSPFQAVWIGDDERDVWLGKVRARADQHDGRFPGPIVFEGNAPADLRENPALRNFLEAKSITVPSAARMWLGAPNSIKGPTEAVFQKRSGSNLLIVGQRDEAVLAMVASGLISLSAQFPRGSAKFIVFESTAPGSPERAFLERVVRAVPHEITLAKPGDLGDVLNKLSEDLQQRISDEHAPAPETFLFLHGMQNLKKLKQEDDFAFSTDDSGANPATQLQKLNSEGPSHGIHVIATLDTYNNVNRFLGRKALSEFEMRVLFQMSTNDSASLCDDPKASTLGLHRALFYNEQEGYLETFRPYALPAGEWIEEVAGKLRGIVKIL